MDFKITTDQLKLKNEIIKFSNDYLNNIETLEKFEHDTWKRISEFGLFGLTIGEEYGGLGETYTTAAIAFEALGYACKNNGLIFAINNHIWVSTQMIYLYGTKELKDKYVADMVQGKKIGAIAITEVEAGTDAMSMRTYAKEDEDTYILNGSKMFISNAPIADVFIVFAVTKSEPVQKITAFVVEKSFEGVSVGKDIEKMGLGACPTAELILNNCRVPKKNILGSFNSGSRILFAGLEWERIFEFVPNIGTMQRIMEQCIKHVNTRKQFGRAIGTNQSLSNKIAEMAIAIEMSRNMLYKITWQKDQKKSSFMESSIFKYYVSSAYVKTCRDAIQIFGGYGYTKEYGLERELRDAIGSTIYSGTNEMQLNTIYSLVSTLNI